MDNRITRFKFCDSRFYPYMEEVIARLPEGAREDVLNDKGFQILTVKDIQDECVLRYRFDDPVKTLVSLDTKILMEPQHQIILTIASEIAHYVLAKRETDLHEKDNEDLLMEWGYRKEVEAVRYDKAISDSKGYKTGYEWAKKQDKEYLLQHFGLYLDAWNERGLGILSREQFERLQYHVDTTSIFEDLIQFKEQDSIESTKNTIEETFSLKEEIVAGIMTAIKEKS